MEKQQNMKYRSIRELTEIDLAAYMAHKHGSILIELGAPWCGPCHALMTALESLAQAETGSLEIVTINVDEYPLVLNELKIRALPTLLLLQDGMELDRIVGARNLHQLRQWLGQHGVPLRVLSSATGESPKLGAFYGDEQLREFLIARFRSSAVAGAIRLSFMPFWSDGKGSPSAALVHSADPIVFERITGMPASFACAMEFVAIIQPNDVDQILGAIRPAMDLSTASLRLMLRWLASDEYDWPSILNDLALDALRQQWIQRCSSYLDGEHVGADEWISLEQAAKKMQSDHDPFREVHDDIATMIATLSPPPRTDDASAWATAMLVHGAFSRARMAEFIAGWSADDRAQPALRHRWLAQHVPRGAGGQRDPSLIRKYSSQWTEENKDFAEKERLFLETRPKLIEKINNSLRGDLFQILLMT